jgi:hypothetical protein
MSVYTFAAPSAGNGQFPDYYNKLFYDAATGSSRAYRFYNTLDVFPNAWASLETITKYYDPAPACTTEIKKLVDLALSKVRGLYAQVGTSPQGSAVALSGTVGNFHVLNITDDWRFVDEANKQHVNSTYESLLRNYFATAGG